MNAHPHPNPFDLSGLDLWIIGGAGHLGQPTVALLTALGARVLCADLGERAHAAAKLLPHPEAVTPATLDACDPEAIHAFVRERVSTRGIPQGLAILTYGATTKTLDALDPGDMDLAHHANLTATLLLARDVGDRMATRGSGSIVLFSSMYGSVAPDPNLYEPPMNPNPIEYGIGKAGIQQMTRYLAVHWGRRGVRVNCISPGPFPNDTVAREHPEFIRRLAGRSPMGRIGQAREIAGAVAFLLGDASSYVTGHNLAVDGGWTSW